jgi:hypothetical protein
MSKTRMINTRFWSDSWIRKLNSLDRYLFLYFLTNEHTNICGVYELPIGTIAYETGMDERDLEKTMIPRLAPKMYYIDEWVYLRNFEKHQTFNESVKIGMERAKKEIPDRIMAKINDILEKGDTVEQGVTGWGVFKSESELKPKLELKPKEREVTVTKNNYSEFNNVKLTDEEYQKLLEKLGSENNRRVLVEELGSYIASTGKRYSSHYATLLNWARRKVGEIQKKQTKIL